jgi:two-component system response regulator AtoC
MLGKSTVLVAESKVEIARFLEVALSCYGFQVELVRDGVEALSYVNQANGRVAMVLIDAHMPRKDGTEAVREIRRLKPSMPVVLLSAGDVSATASLAKECGASGFIELPVSYASLIETVRRLLPLTDEPEQRSAAESKDGLFLCRNQRMLSIRTALRRLASSDVPVVFYGESGVGKEVLARALHVQSHRAHRPFVKLNCAAIPSELLESELFGYERGAFTGAFKNTQGKFEQADGGMLLLDEIGDMDPKLQAKLLHVLQDQEFQRLGGRDTVRVNVRVLAATHCDLETAISAGRFRADLYYRLNVIRIDIPPLRERRDEIIALAELFLKKHSPEGEQPKEIAPDLKSVLLTYDWPGNIRELENVIQRLVVLENPEAIAEELSAGMKLRKGVSTLSSVDVPPKPPSMERSPELPAFDKVNQTKAKMEEQVIRAALDLTFWNRRKAAELLMMDYKALLYRMKKLGISSASQAKAPSAEVA